MRPRMSAARRRAAGGGARPPEPGCGVLCLAPPILGSELLFSTGDRSIAIDPESFMRAMRQCAGAVALVTVGAEPGRRSGLTVTSACSLSDDPPSLLVCVNRNASAHARIREQGHFVINFLNEEHALLALTFSGRRPP